MPLSGKTRSAAAFLAGAVSVLAFSPFDWYLLAPVSLALLFALWLGQPARQAAVSGYLFGLGQMLFGVFWLHISIAQFGGVTLPLAMLAAVSFAAFIALFFALAGWFNGWLQQRTAASTSTSLLLLFPAVWVLQEWLRAHVFTGFPWLSLGYSQADTALASIGPVLGVFGVSWLLAILAGLLVMLTRPTGNTRRRFIVVAALLLSWLSAQFATAIEWTRPLGKPLSVRLVQGNIAQQIKWDPRQLQPTIDLYTSLSFQQQAQLIIWPETAIPAFADSVEQSLLRPLQQRLEKQGSSLLTGIAALAKDRGYYNSVITLGKTRSQYNKRHLVPFGEYAPLAFLLRPLVDYFHIPMSDFRSGEADQPLVELHGQPVGVSICYEDAFGDEVVQALPQATFLINVSNDAWFGDSLAPYQHLQIARMRALETGRYLVRSTNTGISAIVSPQGVITARTQLQQQAALQADIQPMQGSTPYIFWGDRAVILLALLSLLLVRRLASKQR